MIFGTGSILSLFAAYILSDTGEIPVVVTSLDNSSASATLPLNDISNGTVSSIFESPQLASGPHVLQLLVGLSPRTSFYLDSFEVANGTSGALRDNEGGSSVPIGPIIGGVVGGVVVVVCSMLAFYYLYWRKRRSGGLQGSLAKDIDSEKLEETPLMTSQTTIVPFIVTAPTLDSQPQPEETEAGQDEHGELLHRQPTDSGSESSYLLFATSASNPRVMNPDSAHRTADGMVTGAGGSKFAEAYRARSMQAVVLHHMDSGMRFIPVVETSGAGPSTQTIEDVPPVYTES
ncbi:hypothetical protein BDY19DRAFT_12143 [Irpex rosettiformis]|uniref:Uncharacterized protein n=1 Tax=Irpex rosettiformis TaxID=378272 RepID=A0ACB8UIR5_9APHY|nr:hypothetical protein BDY19DRAFT_12143 [Irpex rosettiformis]